MNWTFEHDVMLCREILVIEPFSFRFGSRERGQAWEKIAHNLNQSIYPKFNVDQRAVRDHFLKLERVFKRKIAEEERASGISPESTELDMAMEEIVEKSKEAKEGLDRKNEKKNTAVDAERETAENFRKRSMERRSETSKRENLARAKKRQKMNANSEAVEYLREKSAKESELKEKELELKEKKLLMMEKEQQHKFELERKEHDERMKDLKMRQERENNLLLIMQQLLLQQQQLVEEIKKQNQLMLSLINK